MNLGDIVALAKSGYSVADIKELLSLEVPNESKSETPKTDPAEPDTADHEAEEPEKVDYKALYEAEQKKVKDLQESNTHKDYSKNTHNKSDEEILTDIFKSYY